VAKIKTRRAVDITSDHLRSLIISGEYPPDTLLPPERTLAEELGVNRLTLRAALARLESEKLVVPRQGQGIRVQDWRQTGGLELLSSLTDDQEIVEMLALRRSLAAEAIYGACLHANEEQKLTLMSIARRQEVTDGEIPFFEGDLAFTRALVAGSQSLPLILLFNTIESVCRARPSVLMRMLKDRDAARASYGALLALVRSGEADLARRAVLQALTEADQEALSRILG
jgi:GntR family transcriptional repressor for pyruvate dehydrogenase complex